MILEFKNVALPPAAVQETGLASRSFSLDAGDGLLVLTLDHDALTPLPDLAEGLAEPAEGEVFFMGDNWAKVGPDRGAKLRSRIGRVFVRGGWISNLDVDENVTLAERHHTHRSESEIQKEALALAALFDLPDLPRMRPHLAVRHELRRAQWVRAFLGKPSLIILEQPTRDLDPRWVEALIQQTHKARANGAAVIWITSEVDVWNNDALKATLKFELGEMKMPEAEVP